LRPRHRVKPEGAALRGAAVKRRARDDALAAGFFDALIGNDRRGSTRRRPMIHRTAAFAALIACQGHEREAVKRVGDVEPWQLGRGGQDVGESPRLV